MMIKLRKSTFRDSIHDFIATEKTTAVSQRFSNDDNTRNVLLHSYLRIQYLVFMLQYFATVYLAADQRHF